MLIGDSQLGKRPQKLGKTGWTSWWEPHRDVLTVTYQHIKDTLILTYFDSLIK